MHIVQASDLEEIKEMMRDIRVDPYGIGIMAPKAIGYLLRINSLSNINANILKQEMLSLGADAAVSRDSLTGRRKVTDCLLMGSLSQLNGLKQKLKNQPFGLKNIAEELSVLIGNYRKDEFTLKLPRQSLVLRKGRCYIMGILNLTPDSFSGDGLLQAAGCRLQPAGLVDCAQKMVRDGADIIDVGGESTRPGAKRISAKEESARVIPAVKMLAKRLKVPLSIDTSKAEVAQAALDNGAAIVNDITGLKDARMRRLIARYKAGAVIMHMKGRPQTMQDNPEYGSLLDEILAYLETALKRAAEAGINKENLIIDPGLGFGKTARHNLELLKNLKDFKALGRPVLAGPSRKSFIGKILNAGCGQRAIGTAAACVLAANNGAKIVRVHDVAQVRQALRVWETINRPGNVQ